MTTAFDTPTTRRKALRACEQYAKLDMHIKQCTQGIKDALTECSGVPLPAHMLALTAKSPHTETHLARFYRTGQDIDCSYCQTACDLVLERRTARYRLGAVKRTIKKIGSEDD